MNFASRVLPWALVATIAALALQVFAAGAFVLGGMESPWHGLHVGLGHGLGTLVLAVAVLGFVARDRMAGWAGVAMAGLVLLQTFVIRADPSIRALHVLNAFLVFGAALWLLKDRMPGRVPA